MAKRDRLQWTARMARLRGLVQAAFLFVWLGPFGLRLLSICSPVFHCYSCPLASFACPIGVIANFSALHVVPFLAVGTLLLVGGLIGAIVCGWLCPFGFLQDMIGRIPTPKVRLPAWTGSIRYVVLLGLVVGVPFFLSQAHPLFICSVCPAGALEGAAPSMVQAALAGDPLKLPNVLKLAVTLLVVSAMFISWRPWCRLFCPLGAIYGLLNKLSIVSLGVDPAQCTACGRCARDCRYGIDPAAAPNSTRCIRCLDCTRCPAIRIQAPFSRRPATPPAAADVPASVDTRAPE